jgi:penicillin amidase
LLSWNFVLDKNSIAAGIYEAWLKRVSENTVALMIPANAQPFFRYASTSRLIQWLTSPGPEFGAVPTAGRDSLLAHSLQQAVADLTSRFGADTASWVYGQPKYHYALIMHPMSAAVTSELRKKLDVGPAPRGGDGNTVGATGGSGNQMSGASFRIIADVGDWETTVGTNTPGQVGNPDDPHYRDLFPLWANDRYFPVAYDRSHVEATAESRDWLMPASASPSSGASSRPSSSAQHADVRIHR